MLKDLPIGIDGRHIKAALNILPIDDLVSFSCNHHCALHFSVANDWGNMRLYFVPIKGSQLLSIACSQIFLDDAFHLFDRCWQPVFHIHRGVPGTYS